MWFERRRDADGKVSHSGRIQWSNIIRYALIILLQFWLQPVPYADLNGDNFLITDELITLINNYSNTG